MGVVVAAAIRDELEQGLQETAAAQEAGGDGGRQGLQSRSFIASVSTQSDHQPATHISIGQTLGRQAGGRVIHQRLLRCPRLQHAASGL